MEKYLFYLNGIFLVTIIREREIAQLGRAPGLGPGGRRFKSCFPDLIWVGSEHRGDKIKTIALVVQWIEYSSTKRKVTGSNPVQSIQKNF